jgi:hypothetical protein
MIMTEAELSESAKQDLETGRTVKAESMKQFAERTKGKPTPTQEENDEARLGKYFSEHEADGSDPDPSGAVTKHMESKPGGSYATRQTQATHTRSPEHEKSSSKS